MAAQNGERVFSSTSKDHIGVLYERDSKPGASQSKYKKDKVSCVTRFLTFYSHRCVRKPRDNHWAGPKNMVSVPSRISSPFHPAYTS